MRNSAAVFFGVGLGCLLIATGGGARADADLRVPYPAEYRSWVVVKTVLVGPQSKLHAVRGGFHHIYANPQAITGYKTGTFPEGSVIVDEGMHTTDTDGVLGEGERRSVEVMHKDSRFRETGGWGYERFEGERRFSESALQLRTACFACHTKNKDKDYVFTTLRK